MTRTILVIDDDAEIRSTVAEILEDEGFEVECAANGHEALQRLRHYSHPPPDLILLDMMMPVMDGWTFRAEQQKAPELANIPVLIFSAHNHPGQARSQLCVAGFLRKPLHLEDLIDSVERVISRREAA